MNLIRLENITKEFSGVRALEDVSLELNAGEILSLVGENGAGKSTLMNVLSGSYPHGTFSGEIFIQEKKAQFHSPRDAEAAGIAIIHQELSAFSHLSVAENLFVGHWPSQFGLVNWARLNQEAEKWLSLVGLRCHPEDKMSALSVGAQQMVEIAKALARNSKVLILDEPTSALSKFETETLFKLLKKLRNEGKGLIYISHKMEEIYELSDRLTVLRDGKHVITAPAKDLSKEELLSKMVGRALNRLFPSPPERKIGEEMLRLEAFTGHRANGKLAFGPISLKLHAGEILGLAGLLGAGRTELLQAIFGHNEFTLSGKVFLGGKEIRIQDPRSAWRKEIALVGEDRKKDSLLLGRSLEENHGITRLAAANLSHLLNQTQETESAIAALKKWGTRYARSEQPIESLSGGNQQKVILARALETNPSLVLLDEPTRGVDAGAKFEIYEIAFKLSEQGRAVLLVSSDLLELMALADRILVMSEGRAKGELVRAEFSQTEIMRRALPGPAEAKL